MPRELIDAERKVPPTDGDGEIEALLRGPRKRPIRKPPRGDRRPR